MPVVFLPHGGGPWPFVELGNDPAGHARLAKYLRGVADVPPVAPKALLVISAHWEAPVATVMSGVQPPLLFDYYGFPPASYQVSWAAPGNPALAQRVRALLGLAGFATAEDKERGFDHGTFVPLKLAYPQAEVPVVQLSLVQGLNAERHVAMGRALAPLRDEGVFIIGSGMSFHNLRMFADPRSAQVSATFDAWLQGAATRPMAERDGLLSRWDAAPAARAAHPREEHLVPLMVVAGAAGVDRGVVAYDDTLMNLRLSAYHYG